MSKSSISYTLDRVYDFVIVKGYDLVPVRYHLTINDEDVCVESAVNSWTDLLADIIQYLPNRKFRHFLAGELRLRSEQISVKELIITDISHKTVKRVPRTSLFIDKSYSDEWVIVCLRDLIHTCDKVYLSVECDEMDDACLNHDRIDVKGLQSIFDQDDESDRIAIRGLMSEEWLDRMGESVIQENDLDWVNQVAHGSLLGQTESNTSASKSTEYGDLLASDEAFSADEEENGGVNTDDEVLYFDRVPPKLSHVVPTAVYYNNKRICTVNNWSDLHWQIIYLIQKLKPAFFESSRAKSFFNTQSRDRKLIRNTQLYVDTHKSAFDTVKRIYDMMQLCGVDGANLKITYRHNDKTNGRVRTQRSNSASGVVYPNNVHRYGINDDKCEYKNSDSAYIETITVSKEIKTLQICRIEDNTDYSHVIPVTLVVYRYREENDEVERFNEIERFSINTWFDLVIKLFEFLYKNDNGILRRYARAATNSVITEYSSEQAESDPLCGTYYKFKAGVQPHDLVVAIPEIIRQSIYEPVQFAIEYTQKSRVLTPSMTVPAITLNTQLDNKQLATICQMARESERFQPFLIAYILLNGPQTQRSILDAFKSNASSEAVYRGILYNMEKNKDWLEKQEIGYKRFAFAIPDPSSCLTDPYVQKVFSCMGADLPRISQGITKSPKPVVELDEKVREAVVQILIDHFQSRYARGLRQQEKFREAWRSVYGCEPDFVDIDAVVRSVTMQIGDMDYVCQNVLSPERRDALLAAIEQMFNDEYKDVPYIEYDALLEHVDDLLPIREGAELRIYLTAIMPSGYRYGDRDFCTEPPPERPDLGELLTDKVLEYGEPCPLDTLCEQVPWLSKTTIATTLRAQTDTIFEDKDIFVHIDTIELDEDVVQAALKELTDHNPIVSYNDLIEKIAENPDTESDADSLNRLRQISQRMLQNVLASKWGDNFDFGKAITIRDDTQDDDAPSVQTGRIADILAMEFAGRERVTVEEIDRVVMKHNLVDGFQPEVYRYFYNNFCRISQDEFIADYDISFDVLKIDNDIYQQFSGEYMPLKKLNITLLSPIGYSWNEYLLTSYLYRFSDHYRLRCKTITTKGKNGIGGLIVKSNSTLVDKNYNDVLSIWASKLPNMPENADLLGDILVELGLIMRKSSSLNGIYNKAIQLRGK